MVSALKLIKYKLSITLYQEKMLKYLSFYKLNYSFLNLFKTNIFKVFINQIIEGVVKEYNENGIIINFMNGLLQGKISPEYLHERTIYNFAQNKQQKNQIPQNNQKNNQTNPQIKQKQKQLIGKWILPYDSKKAFTWKLNQKVRFKVQSTNFQKINQKRFSDIIFLRADQQGLGPVSWWI